MSILPQTDTVLAQALEARRVHAESLGTHDGKSSTILVHKDYKLERIAADAHAVPCHSLDNLEHFCDYLLRRSMVGTDVDVLVGTGHAVATIPLVKGGDGDGQAKISCSLADHPELAHWANAVGKAHTQRSLMDVIVARRRDIVRLGDKEATAQDIEILVLQLRKLVGTVEGTTKIELEKDGTVSFSSVTSQLTLSGSLPETITVNVRAIPGLLVRDPNAEGWHPSDAWIEAHYDIELRVHVDADRQGKLSLGLSWPDQAAFRHQVRADVVDMLRGRLGQEPAIASGVSNFETLVSIAQPNLRTSGTYADLRKTHYPPPHASETGVGQAFPEHTHTAGDVQASGERA